MGKPGVVVIKESENTTKSRSTKHLQKRLRMVERRMEQFIEERNTWEEKNKELSGVLNAEKLITASLKKESFHWQRLYHETTIINNTYKMKMFKIAQTLSTCLSEFDSMYPHMVAFTESITTTKLNLKELLNNLPTADYSVSIKRINEGGGINNDNRRTEKPMKHKVGPMVKGLQIVTKPKIMIERLMLPQNRDQIVIDDTVDDLSPNDNPLPAIPEEDEDPCFRHLPVRLKRSKLGTSWRQRRKENLNTEATQERERNNSALVSCNEDSSESEDIPAVIQHVANISRRVKGPLSSKVGSSCGVEEESVSLPSAARHFPMSTEDPMEGSSWMYSNYHPPHSKERRSSIYKSESSDDEDALIVPNKPTNMSTMNTLVMRNHSFDDSMMNKSQSKSESSSTSSSCTPDEPDSTNNVESPINKNLSTKDSKISCSLSSTSSPGVSTDYGTLNSTSTIEQQLSKTHNRLSVCLSKVPTSTPRLSSDCANRFSEVSLSNSPAQSFVTSRKRVRQPNNRRYPSEDYVVPNMNKTNNSKIPKIAIGNKSRKSKITEVRNSKKRLSSRSSEVVENSNNGCDSENSKDNEDTQNKTKRISKSRLSKKSISTSKLSVTNGPQQLQGNIEGPEDKRNKAKLSKPKQGLSKKSTCAPKSSINESQLLQNNESENRLSRRNRNNVCYKESPINQKKRRP